MKSPIGSCVELSISSRLVIWKKTMTLTVREASSAVRTPCRHQREITIREAGGGIQSLKRTNGRNSARRSLPVGGAADGF